MNLSQELQRHDLLQAFKNIELVADLLRNSDTSLPDLRILMAEALEGAHKALFEVVYYEFLEKQGSASI